MNDEIEIAFGWILLFATDKGWIAAVVAVLCAVSSSLVTNMRQCSM